jgi:aldehyde:ferredoxin oxidoreductase
MEIEYGRALFVDVSRAKSWEEIIDESILRSFIGGSGMAAWLFTNMVPSGISPLDPENPLVFALGPLCGTTAPTSGRHEIASLSPLTGLFAESDVGGAWGSAFRATGYDFLVILGASKYPVSVIIKGEEVLIEDAQGIWGSDTFKTSDYYENKYKGSETACIGIAGERLVPIACISHDGRDARMAGRCGLGAVMGSKKIKAIVALPSSKNQRKVYDPVRLGESTRAMARKLPVSIEAMAKYGTSGSLGGFYEVGDVPIKNWTIGATSLDIPGLSGQRLADTGRLKKKFFCTMCPIGCGRVIELSDGMLGGGPEYETICLLGTNCMIDNMEIIIQANERANRLGIDSISAGSAIAFLMEAYEKKELRGVDLSGVVPEWGSGVALLELLDLIGESRGIGILLGEGVAQACKHFGNPEYAIHVKGLELPAHDPRAYNSMALSYATANRGACHLQGMTYNFERRIPFPERGFHEIQDRFGTDRKPELVVESQNYMGLIDSLKLCKFSLGGGTTATIALEWLNLATGWNMEQEEFFMAGERIFNLKRLYNTNRGVSRKDDTLPGRIKTDIKGGGAGANLPPDLETSLDQYYAIRGWTSDGIPKQDKLEELGLCENS